VALLHVFSIDKKKSVFFLFFLLEKWSIGCLAPYSLFATTWLGLVTKGRAQDDADIATFKTQGVGHK